MNRFGEIGQNNHFWSKWPFWAKIAIFGPFLTKNGKNEIFSPKFENVTSVAFISHNFVKKSEKSYEQILRSSYYEHTDEHTEAKP